jgi:transcription initiation factor IIE alpha subunit
MSDISAIIAEIREYRDQMARKSEVQPGDITKDELCRELNVCQETLRKLMKKMVDAGKFTKHVVRGDNGQRVTVFRKVTPQQD